MEFTLDVERHGAASVIRVNGDVDIYTAPRLSDCLQQLVGSGFTHFTIDLHNCRYFDSEGIKVLAKIHRLVDGNGSVKIIGAKGSVLRVLRISGVDSIFHVQQADMSDDAATELSQNSW